jgi:outer membrane lipoprotein SlyB
MHNQHQENTMETTKRLHPLIASAAVSLIVLSAAGTAAITGLLPKSTGSVASPAVASPLETRAAATIAAPGGISLPLQAQEPAPAINPQPVRKAAPRVTQPAPVLTPVSHTEAYEGASSYPVTPVAQAQAQANGTVESVSLVKSKGQATWMGPVAGGLGGAVVGSMLGDGKTGTLLALAGAAGGAFAGHEIEKHVRATKSWDVAVRLDDGSVRHAKYASQPVFHAGERVRWSNGTLLADSRS